MKNKYVGDIGDYAKFGMLRGLMNGLHGFNLGVNWYLTLDDDKTDGLNISYLLRPLNMIEDPELHCALKKIICCDDRQVSELEQAGILAAEFYGIGKSEKLDFYNNKELRKERRNAWHQRALKKLENCNIIFLDPDNGLVPEKGSCTSSNGDKYAAYPEVCDYFNAGSSIIIYNHKNRTKLKEYLDTRFSKLREKMSNAKFICLAHKKIHIFLFVIQPKHYANIEKSLREFANGKWKDSFEIIIWQNP